MGSDIALLIPFFAIAAGIAIPMFAIWTRHRQKLAELQINLILSQVIEVGVQVLDMAPPLPIRGWSNAVIAIKA